MAWADAFMRLRVDSSQVKKDTEEGLKSADGKKAGESVGEEFSNAMTGTFRKIRLALIDVFAVERAYDLFKDFIEQGREAEESARITAAAIKSTGGAAHVTAEDVTELTEAMGKKTGVDALVIRSGANMLLTFRGIRNETGAGNDVFNQATQSVEDMTAAMNGGNVSEDTMRKNAIQVGKALQDPINGVTALRRVGVQLTAQQQAQVAAFVKSGNVMAAQKVILNELGKEFGGAATAAADPMQRLRVMFTELEQEAGQKLLPVMNGVVSFLGDTLEPVLTRVVGGLGNAIGPQLVAGWRALSQQIDIYGPKIRAAFAPALLAAVHQIGVFLGQLWATLVNVGTALTPVAAQLAILGGGAVLGTLRALTGTLAVLGPSLQALGSFVRSNATWFQSLAIGLIAVVGAMKLYALYQGIVTLGTRVWAASMAILDAVTAANPFVLLALAVIALAAAFAYAWTHSATFRTVVEATWNAIASAAETAWHAIMVAVNAVVGAYTTVARAILSAYQTVAGGVAAAWQAVSVAVSAVGGFFARIAGTIGGWVSAIIGWFNQVKSFVTASFDTWWASHGAELEQVWRAVWTAIRYIFDVTFAPLITAVRVGLGVLVAVFRTSGGFISGVWALLWGQISATFRVLWGVVEAAVSFGWSFIRAIFTAEMAIIRAVWNAGWALVVTVLRAAWVIISSVFSAYWAFIVAGWRAGFALLVGVLRVAWALIEAVVKIAWDVVVGIFNVFLDLITGHWRKAWTDIRATATQVVNALRGFLSAAWSAMSGALSSALSIMVGFFRGLPGRILSALGNLGGLLVSGGRNIISGLLNGIDQAVRGIGSWINSHVVQPIVNAVKKYFGIHSPSTVMAGVGGHLISGLVMGLISSNPTAMIGKVFGGMPSALASLIGKGLVDLTSLPAKALNALGAVAGKIGGFLSGLFGGGGGSGVAKYASTILAALKMLGLPSGDLGLVERQMTSESGGNTTAVNRTDINWQEGHPSVGLMQVIAGTFARWAGPFRSVGPFLYGVSTNPLANIYSALNYAMHGAGIGTGPAQLGSGHGYAEGGPIDEPITGIGQVTGQLYSFGEKGREWVVPDGPGKSGHGLPGSGPTIINNNTIRETADVDLLSQKMAFSLGVS